MPTKYKLLRDTPLKPAGTIFVRQGEHLFYSPEEDKTSVEYGNIYPKDFVESNTEWFEPMEDRILVRNFRLWNTTDFGSSTTYEYRFFTDVPIDKEHSNGDNISKAIEAVVNNDPPKNWTDKDIEEAHHAGWMTLKNLIDTGADTDTIVERFMDSSYDYLNSIQPKQ